MTRSKMMRTRARSGDGDAVTTDDVLKKEPSPLCVPVRSVEGIEGITLGFRQEMLKMGDVGDVSTGTGLGTDFIILKWGDRQAVVRGSELLRAWVATFAPEDAARFPDGIVLLDDK